MTEIPASPFNSYARRVCRSCSAVGEHVFVGHGYTQCANCGNAQPDTVDALPAKPVSTIATHRAILEAGREAGAIELASWTVEAPKPRESLEQMAARIAAQPRPQLNGEQLEAWAQQLAEDAMADTYDQDITKLAAPPTVAEGKGNGVAVPVAAVESVIPNLRSSTREERDRSAPPPRMESDETPEEDEPSPQDARPSGEALTAADVAQRVSAAFGGLTNPPGGYRSVRDACAALVERYAQQQLDRFHATFGEPKALREQLAARDAELAKVRADLMQTYATMRERDERQQQLLHDLRSKSLDTRAESALRKAAKLLADHYVVRSAMVKSFSLQQSVQDVLDALATPPASGETAQGDDELRKAAEWVCAADASTDMLRRDGWTDLAMRVDGLSLALGSARRYYRRGKAVADFDATPPPASGETAGAVDPRKNEPGYTPQACPRCSDATTWLWHAPKGQCCADCLWTEALELRVERDSARCEVERLQSAAPFKASANERDKREALMREAKSALARETEANKQRAAAITERDAARAELAAWLEPGVPSEPTTLAQDVASALNRHSAENGSNTPDFILAEYLLGCLATWNAAARERERWYGRAEHPCSAPNALGAGPREGGET